MTPPIDCAQLTFRNSPPVLPSTTAIQPVLAGSARRALRLSRRLLEDGFLVSAIRPPTVPLGTSRLRVTLSAAHSQDDVEALIAALERALSAEPEDSDVKPLREGAAGP